MPDRLLGRALCIADRQRMPDALDADPLDREMTLVDRALDVG